MMRLFFKGLGYFALLGCLAGTVGALGYFAHKNKIEPIFSLAERVDAKFRREAGLPSSTVGIVDRIETIFVNLRGKVYTMPGQDFQGGGALAVWGDDILIMHVTGRVFTLVDEQMELTNFRAPENGLAGLPAMLERPEFTGRLPLNALRFHDLEFVETPEKRGILLSYTFLDIENECYRTRVDWLDIPRSVATIHGLDPTDQNWERFFETSPCLPFNERGTLLLTYMAGGRLSFQAPSTVYLGSGEYHLDGIYRPDAGIQSDDSDYGKTIAIDLMTRESRHISKGHRNLQGVAVDAIGQLWTSEHGMRGGDELNLIIEGENYGWPLEDMGTLYSGIPAPSIPGSGPGRHVIYKAPVYAWVPSAAVSSLEFVKNFDETWDGDLLVGSLKARTLHRMRLIGDRLISIEPIYIGQRIRDVMMWGDKIALWLDSNEFVTLSVEERKDPLDGLVAALTPKIGADMAEQVIATMEGCAECHSYEENIHGAGPSLFGLHGRIVAGTAFAYYSDGLKAVPGRWTTASIQEFLSDPDAWAPGTTMASYAVTDPELAAGVALGFEWLGEKQKAE